VHNLLVVRLVKPLEMRDVERTHRFDRRAQGIVDAAMFSLRFLNGAKDAQDLCAVEALSFTMVTEAHSHLAFTPTARPVCEWVTDKLSQALKQRGERDTQRIGELRQMPQRCYG